MQSELWTGVPWDPASPATDAPDSQTTGRAERRNEARNQVRTTRSSSHPAPHATSIASLHNTNYTGPAGYGPRFRIRVVQSTVGSSSGYGSIFPLEGGKTTYSAAAFLLHNCLLSIVLSSSIGFRSRSRRLRRSTCNRKACCSSCCLLGGATGSATMANRCDGSLEVCKHVDL